MKIITGSICLFLLVFILACQGVAPTATVSSSGVPAPTETAISTVMPTATAAPTSMPDPAACKLPVSAYTNVGMGFPRLENRIPSTGEVKAVVLFVDFSDAPASETPENVFSVISPNAEKFYKDISYGRMDFTLHPHFVWLRLSQPSVHYGNGLSSFEGHQAFIQEAVDLADADVDFSSADMVIVMANPLATAVGFGPAFGGDTTNGINADGVVIPSAVTSGADLYNWGFLWLNHETGHAMALVDLYDYTWNSPNYDDLHKFVGNFGLMGYIDGTAPEFFAFERWMLGWLDDEQIFCQQTADETISLSAIETTGGIKAVMIPISATKAVVVESRRPLGYDTGLIKSGALVYTVDTSIYSGMGTIVVLPILENDPYRDQSPLAVGESVTVDNVTITVLEASDEGDVVQITISK